MTLLTNIGKATAATLCLFAGTEAVAIRSSGAELQGRAAKASKGCGQHHNFVGNTRQFSIPSSGGDRSYRIHLASNYEENTPRPLMIVYHGSGGRAEEIEGITRFSDEGLNPDMITVYPQGVNGNWQGPSYATGGVSDKVFTTDLVNHIKDHYCVDESRVYAVGKSNGGGFVGTLACSPEHGGQFAAFAAVAGAFYTDVHGNDNCHPARSPLPILEVHGTGDPTINYNGGNGRGGELPSIEDWLHRWAERDQCEGPTTTDLDNGVHDLSWKCAGIDGLLRHIKVDGHDHSYPGQGDQIDVSPVILDFLSANYKP